MFHEVVAIGMMLSLPAMVRVAAQPPDTLWTKYFGGEWRDYALEVVQTNDGGFAFAGQTYSYGAGDSDVWIVKTDANGDTIWTRTYGGSEWDGCFDIQQTTDEGYIAAGWRTDSFIPGWPDVWLLKMDQNGDTLWSRIFGDQGHDIARSVCQLDDGGYLIAGETGSFGAQGLYDGWLIRTDSLGFELWNRLYGGGGADILFDAQPTPDGGFIALGHTETPHGTLDLYLVRADSRGNQLWSQIYGYEGWDVGYGILQSPDGGYVLAGFTADSTGSWDLWLLRTDLVGDTLWTRKFGGSGYDGANGICWAADSGYVMAGFYSSEYPMCYDVWILKCDTDGDSLWSILMGMGCDTLSESGHDIEQTEDGGFIVAASIDSSGSDSDAWLIRLDSEVSSAPYSGAASSFHISVSPPFPNPCNASTIFSFELPVASYVSLKVYDIGGRFVETLVDGWRGAGEYEVTFDGSNLPSGIYLARLEAGEFSQVRKMVLLK
jgi:hypothetical protein